MVQIRVIKVTDGYEIVFIEESNKLKKYLKPFMIVHKERIYP